MGNQSIPNNYTEEIYRYTWKRWFIYNCHTYWCDIFKMDPVTRLHLSCLPQWNMAPMSMFHSSKWPVVNGPPNIWHGSTAGCNKAMSQSVVEGVEACFMPLISEYPMITKYFCGMVGAYTPLYIAPTLSKCHVTPAPLKTHPRNHLAELYMY